MEPINEQGIIIFQDRYPAQTVQQLVGISPQISDQNTNITIISKKFQSSNYQPGVRGWKLDSNGVSEFN